MNELDEPRPVPLAGISATDVISIPPDDTVEIHKVLCSREVLRELQSSLMLFYTGITRSASALHKEQSATIAADNGKLKAMDRMVAIAAAVHADINSNRLDTLGPGMHESWQLKKQLANGISNPVIDAAYAAAMAAGAEGGKLLGAGGGGFLLFIVPQDRQEAVRQALCGLRETSFKFAPQGSRIIFVH